MKLLIGLLITLVTIILFSFVFPAPKIFNVAHADKIYHVLSYLFFTLFLTLTLSRSTQLNFPLILLISIVTTLLLGGLIELAQYFTLRRTPDLFDFFANGLGVLIGSILYIIFFMKK